MDPDVLAAVRALTAPETDAMLLARERASGSLHPPSPEVGALLRWTAGACGARTVVEVGAAGGISGLWVLPGLLAGGVLTVIEPNPHAHALAADAYVDAGYADRVRLIHGEVDTVLPRLSDGGYDVMVVQTHAAMEPGILAHAHRLLRPGGMFVARGVVQRGEFGDQLALFVEALYEDDILLPTLLPLDGGVALSLRRTDPDS